MPADLCRRPPHDPQLALEQGSGGGLGPDRRRYHRRLPDAGAGELGQQRVQYADRVGLVLADVMRRPCAAACLALIAAMTWALLGHLPACLFQPQTLRYTALRATG